MGYRDFSHQMSKRLWSCRFSTYSYHWARLNNVSHAPTLSTVESCYDCFYTAKPGYSRRVVRTTTKTRTFITIVIYRSEAMVCLRLKLKPKPAFTCVCLSLCHENLRRSSFGRPLPESFWYQFLAIVNVSLLVFVPV